MLSAQVLIHAQIIDIERFNIRHDVVIPILLKDTESVSKHLILLVRRHKNRAGIVMNQLSYQFLFLLSVQTNPVFRHDAPFPLASEACRSVPYPFRLIPSITFRTVANLCFTAARLRSTSAAAFSVTNRMCSAAQSGRIFLNAFARAARRMTGPCHTEGMPFLDSLNYIASAI